MSVTTNVITNVFDDNVVSSVDIIFRIEELIDRDDLDENETAELAALQKFKNDYDHVTDWQYGAHFIAEEYFTEYVKDMLNDCGIIPRDLPDYVAIDWEETADNLKCDYEDAEFNGVSYYVLSV